MRTIKPGPDEIPSSDLYDYVVGNHSNPGSYICYGIHIETLTFAWNILLVKQTETKPMCDCDTPTRDRINLYIALRIT
jgi:hypothetical protein